MKKIIVLIIKFIGSMSTFIKTASRMLFILLSVLATALLVTLIILLVNSSGKPEPCLDNHGKPVAGSISEKIFIEIGGVRQGMFIRGMNINNPVLLYLHGGPAFPNYFLIDKYKPGLEEIFTVCYWEQRGGGLSYSQNVTPESMNFGQLASDAIEVTNYLRERFGKGKIYMLAHSGGTPFAIMAAAKAPHLYHAYMGMAQITSQAESEKLAYNFMLGKYTAAGNEKVVKEFGKYAVNSSDEDIIKFYKSPVRDESMHDLGIGTMRNMRSVIKGVFIPVWMCKAYTIKEKINIWYSKFAFIKRTKLIDELFATDLTVRVPELEIPVYFFSGKHDLTVNHDLSESYLDKLRSPLKAFYTFNESAHSPLFEEPQRFKAILIKDVIK